MVSCGQRCGLPATIPPVSSRRVVALGGMSRSRLPDSVAMSNSPATIIAIGPRMPGWGSWDWVGADLAGPLGSSFDTVAYEGSAVPRCDVAIVVKHLLPAAILTELAERSAIIFAPVDAYGDEAEITADVERLRLCSRIVVHCGR